MLSLVAVSDAVSDGVGDGAADGRDDDGGFGCDGSDGCGCGDWGNCFGDEFKDDTDEEEIVDFHCLVGCSAVVVTWEPLLFSGREKSRSSASVTDKSSGPTVG